MFVAGFIQVKHNERTVASMRLTEESDLETSVEIIGRAEDDGSLVTCLAVQNVSGAVKHLSASVRINVFCK